MLPSLLQDPVIFFTVRPDDNFFCADPDDQ